MNTLKQINKYRTFCQTENDYVYTWGTTPPTNCPKNVSHTIDPQSISIVDTVSTNNIYVDNVPRCPYGEWRVAEKSLVIELKSCVGKSALRDIDIVTGSGSVTNSVGDPEYRLSTTLATDSAKLYSAERGRYISGIGAEVGIGVRIPKMPVGNQVYTWGLYDDNNGFFYMLSASGLSVCIRRDGVDEIIPSSSFNGNWDQSLWDPKRGFVYNIMFSWYGYGSISFIIQNKPNFVDPYSRIHTFDPYDKTSLKNPNLPVSASILNNGTVASGEMYVAGRQYSVLGKYNPIYRLSSAYRISCPVNSTSVFLPILSVRRKQGYNSTAVKLSGVDLISTTTQLIQVRVGTLLNTSSFQTLQDHKASETVMEYDVTASSMTDGGTTIWTGICSADKSAIQKLEDFTYVLTEYAIVTICAKAVSATNGNVTCCMRMSEEW